MVTLWGLSCREKQSLATEAADLSSGETPRLLPPPRDSPGPQAGAWLTLTSTCMETAPGHSHASLARYPCFHASFQACPCQAGRPAGHLKATALTHHHSPADGGFERLNVECDRPAQGPVCSSETPTELPGGGGWAQACLEPLPSGVLAVGRAGGRVEEHG